MTVPAGITINTQRPHVFWRENDRTELVTRTTSSSQWKSVWDDTIVPRANQFKVMTNSQLAESNEPHSRLLVLTFVGWILEVDGGGNQTRPAGGYKDAAIRAAVYLSGLPDVTDSHDKRNRLYAMAIVFDACYSVMTSSERNSVAAEIIAQIDRMNKSPSEQMDGWSGNDQAAAFAGSLSVVNYSSFASAALSRFNSSMSYFFGADAFQGRVTMERYERSDGGSEKGSWYSLLGGQGTLWVLWFLKNATSYDSVAQEASWGAKFYEWYLWICQFGEYDDIEPMGDMAKLLSPKMAREHRQIWAAAIAMWPGVGGSQGGQMLRDLFDTWDGYVSADAEKLIWNVVFLDKAGIPPVAPASATTPPAPSRMFAPPGIYYHRNVPRGSGAHRWHRDLASRIRISARKFFWQGHRHLDAGGVRMDYQGDPLLLAPAGYYDDFSGVHHTNAYQRSWLQSCCPIVKDPAAVYQYQNSTVVNDGGQHFRRYRGFQAPSKEYDPTYVHAMVNDAGGTAWRVVERFEKREEVDGSHVFLIANIREAYKKFHDDPQRCPILECKYLVIEPTADNGLVESALLVYTRIKKTNTSWVTQIPFHFSQAFTQTAYGGHALGYNSHGKLWINIRAIADYSLIVNPPGSPLDSLGYGPNQFKPSGSGTNYKPIAAAGERHLPDVKRHSLYLEKTVREEEEHYVYLLQRSGAADSHPAASAVWASDAAEPDWYTLILGTTTYRMHRTLDLAVVGSPDTTPPAEVTDAAVEARDRALLARWTDPADSDYDHAQVWIRTSAT